MTDCLFCKIAAGTIPVTPIFEDDRVIAFADINPQAPTHFLVIPREHFADVTQVPAELLGHLLHAAARVAETQLPHGHRIAINTGPDGGQTVQHVHLHVLGGRPMGWPPG
ncbi:histidine triad nucleotide-binding protein [Granulicella tundricola]|uniref:Histidine triad (HIT) protein n=1 Tax=Granulicella tundricola (strain ATCC BAA-1859 / DSM 23138 / MP5ACTX9) TaxID=1198114 RepID=E8WZU7_GRATM|nr:histidine triad nucleotide-binding protein [Granulicella tundricola]ADW67758.1 histidine triad (HIT) protein [Granulicella tundricola MP5ACTX9]